MTGRNWIGWAIAGVLSLGLHGVLAAATGIFAPDPRMDGGTVEGEIALGSGFADLVQGRSAPVAPDRKQRTEPPKTRDIKLPVTPDKAGKAAVEPTVETPPPQRIEPAPADKMTAMAAPITPQAHPAVMPAKQVIQPRPTPEFKKFAPAPGPKALTALTDPPKKSQIEKAELKPKLKPIATGNAKANSKTGTSGGKKTGNLSEASKRKAETSAKQVGDGAARSYQRTVLRKIARVPKRKAGARGNALVGMVIAPSGAIASLRIVRSSGNDRIDRMALDTVRRAGPFAPTPNSSQMKLIVEMKSKG